MGDLHDPENAKTEVEYDESTGTYHIGTKIGDSYLNTPIVMTPEEYNDWTMRRSMNAYYRSKNQAAVENGDKDKFDFTDMHFDLGPAEKIFGPGGVQIKTQGSAELKLGANMKNIDNPSLPIKRRKTFGFDFDEKVNLSLQGSIGDKMNMNLNYNTEATFDFDSKNLKLAYEGKEDEIVKLIEGGNISMPTNNSLITGSSSLFGIRTDLQFGKLKLQAVASQKKSITKSVSSQGGSQLTSFEISADNYESNRHFFLSHFFREHYDKWMSTLPNITSGITINRVEVWITNKNGTTTNTRNIVAFADLAEHDKIGNTLWTGSGTTWPQNASNNLYATINEQYTGARDISQVYSTLAGLPNFEGGKDYEKLESARKLSSSEYDVNTKLGYISLKTTLQTDQVLAVAYEYTYLGQTYQVGEFSTDQTDNTACLYVKALKNAANTPQMPNWQLMMRNVYSLGASNVENSKFRLDIKYLNDTSGVYISYLPEEGYKNSTLLKLLGLDRLDNKNNAHSNGYFDFVDGYTIDRTNGRIFFPSAEPFGSYLRGVINNNQIAEKYVYQELYDSTLTNAKQVVEKDKFLLTGQYQGSSGNTISLGATNVPRGSVVVTAGGVTLSENSDYTVNYATGEVTIINQSIIDAGTAVSVSLESTGETAMERKTLLGLNWEYDFSKNFLIGGTLMHLSEQSMTTKIAMGNEPLNNTMIGLNLSWKTKSQWLTDMLDKLPFVNCTQPSTINFSAEFAQLITGKNTQSQSHASYLDDFENTKGAYDIGSPTEWMISSTPLRFEEATLSNNIQYGFNRALLSWYYIDPLFTRRSSSLTPSHIKSDVNQLSNHYVREVSRTELFPNKQLTVGESTTLDVLNLAYYPSDRGPYNLNPNLDYNGHLQNPKQHWGGMMRALETTDFETANIEYIEFWLLDPFIYTRGQGGDYGGDLYFDLGDISEDILKDGSKFYESGMPLDGNSLYYNETVWGRVPNQTTVTYAFNTSSGSRARQDIGLNGLSSAEEAQYETYANYLRQIQGRVSPEVFDSLALDPAGDDYHYFRGSDFDRQQTSILNRYRRINMPEGNSVDSENSPESYSTAYKTTPDVEDLNKDYTLNEYNNYYEYRVRLHPDSMEVGRGYIVDRRHARVTLRNGEKPEVDWYLFRIPLDEYLQKQGNINDFSSVRFMRMYLTNFAEPVVLRFGTLQLVRGDWRNYEHSLNGGISSEPQGSLDVSAVSVDENNEKTPVNYVLPPGVELDVDRGNRQLTENNEQALNITVKNLPSGEARAVYKKYNLDLRQYKHIQMFAHANALTGDATLKDDETAVFIRFGSDYRNNYYEYEIPLKLTPAGHYDRYTDADCRAVWPDENMLDIDFSLLTDLKKNRNKQKSLGLANYAIAYSEYDPNHPNNKVTVCGNPSIGDIRTMMIGVRNNSRSVKSVEVWVNELRLQGYTDDGGWAARAKLDMQLSDVATIAATGHIETSGFGGIEQGINERRNSDLYEYSVTTNVQLGRFLPEKAKIQAPLYYSYSHKKVKPRYNPLDTDMLLDDALDACGSKRERDSLENIVTTTSIDRNFSLSNMKVNIATKNHPMPYDPANFSFSYSHSHRYTSGETTVWEKDDSWRFGSNYNYTPSYTPYQPFKNVKSKSPWWKILKEEKLNWLPQNLTINSDITRTYYELQERDMENLTDNSLPLNWSSDFLWNRSLNLNWDFTNNIHASLHTATNAEIVEPYTPVNKSLYPDEYTEWKDSVWHSLKHFGTPLTFRQDFNASWKLPLNLLPCFKWLTADLTYDSSYGWDRGTTLSDGSTLGNTINSTRNTKVSSRLNLLELYNLSPFLKKTNRYYSSNSGSSQSKRGKNKKDEGEDTKKKFEKEIQLYPDSTFLLHHNQRTRRIKVSALREDGKRYPLRYKIKNSNTLEILSRDTVKIKVSVLQAAPPETQSWYRLARGAARFAMMLRNVNISYTNAYSMSLPGFMPNVGDFFGQNNRGGMLKPGVDFAFGLVGDGYIDRAKRNGWLLNNDSVSTPAATNLNDNLLITATLEPFEGFKIDLTANRTTSKARSIQYMYEGMPTTQSGTFTMTTISIGSAFESRGNADNNYQSKSFNRFCSYLDAFRDRVEARYAGAVYPATSTLAGQTFDPANGSVDKYSADVMIPAFLAAYTGGGTSGSLDIFPSLKKLLPNWKLTYSGLMRLRWFKDHFKSVNIEHAYKSVYSVGSYNSYSSYMEYMNGLGFVTNATTGNPVPSSMYDISTVSINESFSPLCGISLTFLNDITANLRYNQTRILTLSLTSQQITEAISKDLSFGFGYKIPDLKLFGTPKRRRITNSRSKSATAKKGNQNNKNNDNGNTTATDVTSSEPQGMANPLNISLSVTYRDQSAINRNILTMLSQATSGNTAFKITFAADYTVSKLLTLSAYYDRQMNKPLLSSSSYPTTTQDFGISMKFSLAR